MNPPPVPDDSSKETSVAAVDAPTETLPQPVSPPSDPPDGGLLAWMQVAGCFALYFNHLGLLNSFGVFQTYYETHLKDSSPSAISWIGSVQVFCLMSISVFVGPLYDAGHCKALLLTGTFLVTFGFMMTSICEAYWQILLAQGICMGLGTCCLQIPSIAVVPKYFVKRRARAMALATVGSSLGATIYPLMFQNLQPRIGFGWTVRIMGFICFALCSFAIVVIRPRQAAGSPPKKRLSPRKFIDSTALKEPTYIIYTVAIFFSNVAYFEPIFYLQSYALEHGMRNQNLANYLLSILNASSIPGRIVPSTSSTSSSSTTAAATAATATVPPPSPPPPNVNVATTVLTVLTDDTPADPAAATEPPSPLTISPPNPPSPSSLPIIATVATAPPSPVFSPTATTCSPTATVSPSASVVNTMPAEPPGRVAVPPSASVVVNAVDAAVPLPAAESLGGEGSTMTARPYDPQSAPSPLESVMGERTTTVAGPRERVMGGGAFAVVVVVVSGSVASLIGRLVVAGGRVGDAAGETGEVGEVVVVVVGLGRGRLRVVGGGMSASPLSSSTSSSSSSSSTYETEEAVK
ncbi:putative transporter MCH4 [Diplodia seriata]|uniref:Putative transporter MCH4 n=1 Tax=Diplodia seriata TaxID=420778 RepID=A0A1S8BA71_9PEZI|nr:putative transporter MCH4 [Diplodia seriata]